LRTVKKKVAVGHANVHPGVSRGAFQRLRCGAKHP
jgi:hypothetical protein